MARDLGLEQRWRERIKEHNQSGLNIQAWCLQNGLKYTTYHYWLKRFKLLEQQQGGAEMILPSERKTITHEIRPIKAKISLSFGDYSIGVEDDFNPSTLVELVKVLRKL